MSHIFERAAGNSNAWTFQNKSPSVFQVHYFYDENVHKMLFPPSHYWYLSYTVNSLWHLNQHKLVFLSGSLERKTKNMI